MKKSLLSCSALLLLAAACTARTTTPTQPTASSSTAQQEQALRCFTAASTNRSQLLVDFPGSPGSTLSDFRIHYNQTLQKCLTRLSYDLPISALPVSEIVIDVYENSPIIVCDFYHNQTTLTTLCNDHPELKTSSDADALINDYMSN